MDIASSCTSLSAARRYRCLGWFLGIIAVTMLVCGPAQAQAVFPYNVQVASPERLKLWMDEVSAVDQLYSKTTGPQPKLVAQLQQLAEAGNGIAATVLFQMYLNGGKAFAEALIAHDKEAAAEGGNIEAYEAANKDSVLAMNYARMATAVGEPDAMVVVAVQYLEKGDFSSALVLIRGAAEAGNVSGALLLGEMYAKGVRVEKNPLTAIKWLRKAGAAGAKELSAVMATLTANEQKQLQKEKEAEEIWQRYSVREKTLIEKVLNYQTTGIEEGSKFEYWVVDPAGNKCTATRHFYPYVNDLVRSEVVNLMQFNQRGFTFSPNRFGDERTTVRVYRGEPRLERLQKAWNLAFKECPGKKSDF